MQRSIILSSLNNARTLKVVGTWYQPHFNHEGHVEGHVYTPPPPPVYTVPLTDSHLHLKPGDSILETFEGRVSRIESRGSSFKFGVEKYELVVRARTNQCSP